MNIDSIKLYQLNDEKEERLWRTAIFVFDSSALLDFYYLPKKTREKIYSETFKHLDKRLWIPAHVEYEFLKNKDNVINKSFSERYDNLKNQVININPSFIKAVQKQVEDIGRQTEKDDKHPHIGQTNIEEIKTHIADFELKLKKFEQNILAQISEAESEIYGVKENDDLLEAIDLHFSVGNGYSFDEIVEITREGKHRYEFKIPPGYGDFHKAEKKGTQIFGDLIVWKQILDYSKEVNLPIIFITNDIKKDEDWCYFEKVSGDDRIVAPREELIKEIYDHSSVEFWMYNLPQFLFNSKNYLKSDISDQAIQFISQYLNTKDSTGNYLRFKCNSCEKIHSYHKSEFDLDFELAESSEKSMGTENRYEAMESFGCTCGNEITATFEVWEYPSGVHNNNSIELDSGELLASFYFTIDFFQDDDDDDFLICEECDGSKEGHGNYVTNWVKRDLDNEFHSDHSNGRYSKVMAGTCEWCSTLHVKCPKCDSINSFPEAEAGSLKECQGGCGLNFILESENSPNDFFEFTLKLKDERITSCESCGDEFLDENQTSVCQKCEEESSEK